MDISGNLKNHNFIVTLIDSDSCMFGKQDKTSFSQEEIESLNEEINSLYGEHIKWDFEDSYKKVIALKTKNYVLLNEKNKITIKGSALKASTKSPALKQFIRDIINNILEDKNDYVQIYNNYAKQIAEIKDIVPWSVRKTISDKVLKNERKNELNVREAIKGTEIVEGDRIYVFYKDSGELCLAEKFTGDYSKDRLYQSLYDTMKIFITILPIAGVILNYKLKKNKKALALL